LKRISILGDDCEKANFIVRKTEEQANKNQMGCQHLRTPAAIPSNINLRPVVLYFQASFHVLSPYLRRLCGW